MKRATALFLLALAALLGGCAQLVPQTVALRTDWPAEAPKSTEIAGVPFFPQADYQCGPAALATVLSFSGVQVTPEPLVNQVYLPSRRGTLQVEMLAAARRYGRVAYPLAPSYPDLLREVAAGNPVVVLQDIGPIATQWHYAVVYGYDYPSGTIYLRSGTDREHAMPFTAFERSWLKGGYWAMVALPPDRLPASATEASWVKAAVAMERAGGQAASAATAAYETALRRWPGNLSAAIGLANRHHAAGRLPDAEAVLRAALARSPQSTIVLNNLAQVLSDQGRQAEALAQIDKAADPMSPFAAEVRETRQAILKRMEAAPARGAKTSAAK